MIFIWFLDQVLYRLPIYPIQAALVFYLLAGVGWGELCLFLPHVRESKTVLDSGFQYMSVERGFWIPVVSGIPNSLSCIPDFTRTEFSWIPDSASKNFPDSGIQINSSS